MSSCQICGKDDSLQVISSGCAPVTYLACSECIERQAENIDVLMVWLSQSPTELVRQHVPKLTSYVEGSYVDGHRILKIFEKMSQHSVDHDLDDDDLIDVPLT